jgi:HPt (histidine-containing phosphotransfer) domain-containing protein
MNEPTACFAPSNGVPTAAPPQVDIPALRARAGDDEELVREVLADFLRDVGDLRGVVDGSVGDGRFADAGRAAHRIRGALLALGAGPAAGAASALEACAFTLASGTEPAAVERGQIAALLAVFGACLDAACAEMRRYLGDGSRI